MPRTKFKKRSVWIRTPHGDSYPPGLWWCQTLAPEESRHVLLVYLERRAYQSHKARAGTLDERWQAVCRALEIRASSGKVPRDFPKKLELWISDLMTNQGTKRKAAYWTLDGYALAHKISKHPFLSWFRAMEKVARELYPDHVPIGRRDTPPLSEETKQAMRAEYLKTGNAKEIAAKYGIEPWRVGQICHKERQIRKAEWDERRAKAEAGQEANAEVGLISGEEESPF